MTSEDGIEVPRWVEQWQFGAERRTEFVNEQIDPDFVESRVAFGDATSGNPLREISMETSIERRVTNDQE